MAKAELIATLAAPPSAGGEEITALSDSVEWLEVRADLAGEIDPGWLRNRFRGRLLYSLRSRVEGGSFDESGQSRHARLQSAARHYDLIDMEGDRDLLPHLLAGIPAQKRLLSWHGRAEDMSELRARFARLSAIEARVYKLVSTAHQTGEELIPLTLLNSLKRSDIIAFAEGQTGFWTRLIAPRLGSPMIFGIVGNKRGSCGEPTVSQLIEDYGLPAMPELEAIYGIVGNPTAHSLSPRLHNAAYRALGHPALFLPFQVESFPCFLSKVARGGILESLGMPIRGFTVASPYKEAALVEAGTSSLIVQRAGSSNLLVRNNGHWRADTTDPEGVITTLREQGIFVKGKRVAVVGCGGSGRAMAAALDQAGADVTLVNRGRKRGELAVRLLGLPFVPLTEFSVEGYSIIVHATPVGRDIHQLPFEVDNLSKDAVVVDLVYGPAPTPLVTRTRALGRTAIDGRDVLIAQVLRQFHLMTGKEMPVALARGLLGWERPRSQTESSA